MLAASAASAPAKVVLPTVQITSPDDGSYWVKPEITITGVASFTQHPIRVVEVYIKNATNTTSFPYLPAQPITPGNWSKWSLKITVPFSGLMHLSARVTDADGNQNWDDIQIKVPFIDPASDKIDENLKIIVNKPFSGSTLVDSHIVIQGSVNYTTGQVDHTSSAAYYANNSTNLNYLNALPYAPGNWSNWQATQVIKSSGPITIVLRSDSTNATHNWTFISLNVPFIQDSSSTSKRPLRVAIVEPTFTWAAYGPNGFYYFYAKYLTWPVNSTITTDLNLLTSPVTPNTDNDELARSEKLLDIVRQVSANPSTAIIKDQDASNGNIFLSDGSNAFDLLILQHEEYVTQTQYDNYQTFVRNGGTIIYLDSNVFYAEVRYDSASDTVTLLKGHDWKFDGHSVKRDISERYFYENRAFLGSNYNINELSDQILFANNPFNYTHFEENYVTNPKAHVLYDYQILYPSDYENDEHPGSPVATYVLDYGKGKNIMMGIFGTNIENNPNFKKFFSDVLMLYAIGSTQQIQGVHGLAAQVYTHLKIGSVESVDSTPAADRLTLHLTGVNQVEFMYLSLPNDAMGPSASSGIQVLVDNKTVPFHELKLQSERVITLTVPRNVSSVQIVGSQVTPEFPEVAVAPLLLSLIFVVVIFVARSYLRSFSKYLSQ